MTPEEKETLRGVIRDLREFVGIQGEISDVSGFIARLEALVDTKVELPDPGTFVACLEEATQGNEDEPHWVEWFDPEKQFLIDSEEVTWCLKDIGKWTEIGEYEMRPLLRRISAIKPKNAVGTEVELDPKFDALSESARYVADYALGCGNPKWLNLIDSGCQVLVGIQAACEGIYDPVVAVKAVARVYDLPVPKNLSHKDFMK